MLNMVSIAVSLIILLLHPIAAGAQNQVAQDEDQRVKSLNRILDNGSYQEKNKAILELSWPRSAKASELLLKRLKHNLANNKGNQESPWASSSDGVTTWGTNPSENALMVSALVQQHHVKAVPTLRKMLMMKPERSGISKYNLAYSINQLTNQPVEYKENGERKIFPEPAVKP